MQNKTIYLGADHAGWEYKEAIEVLLKEKGYDVVDKGDVEFQKEDDYPDYGYAVAKAVAGDPASRGVLLCGNAQGICITANKIRGIRAATGFNIYAAKSSREDDDSNILCLPARALSQEETQKILEAWLSTEFSGAERHKRRLEKLKEIEEKEFKN